jgi:uncharacterized protein
MVKRLPTVSGPARGKDFFNRKKEIAQILRSIDRENILLISPRRYGKTSLMRETERQLRANGKICFFLDVMSVDSPEEFILNIADIFFAESGAEKRRKILDSLKGVFSRIEEIEAGTQGVRVKFRDELAKEVKSETWTHNGEEVFKALARTQEAKPVFIFIDEFSECVNNIATKNRDTAAKFLQWLRHVRSTMPDDLRFILSGSISIDRVVKPIAPTSLSWINDFKRINVEGFTDRDALEFVQACFISEGLNYTNNIGRKVLNCLGEPHLPYFIALFSSIIDQKSNGGKITESIIEQMYVNNMLGISGQGYFVYYRQRLKAYPQPLDKAAENILKEACHVAEGYDVDLAFSVFEQATALHDPEIFRSLVMDLENDFYVSVTNNKICFKSKVLNDWWRSHYV